jgi:hypothetical protein
MRRLALLALCAARLGAQIITGGGGGGGANVALPTVANNVPLFTDTVGSFAGSNLSQEPNGALTPLQGFWGQVQTVAENAGAPVIDLSNASYYLLTVTQNDTITVVNGNTANGAQPVFVWSICQDGVGNHTVTLPAGFGFAASVDKTANICTIQRFRWDGTTAWPESAAFTTQPGFFAGGPVRTAPATPPASSMACWFDTTSKTLQCINDAGAKSGTVLLSPTPRING